MAQIKSPPQRSLPHFHFPRISRLAHGILDYFFGVLIASSPWIFGFTNQHLAPQIAVVLGVIVILYSIVTDYEAGVLRFMPFSGNLFFDFVVGVALAGSPIHFAMGGRAGLVFVILGIMQIAIVLLTRRPRESENTN